MIANTSHHDNHHSKNVGNYGGSCYFWDLVLDTYTPYCKEFWSIAQVKLWIFYIACIEVVYAPLILFLFAKSMEGRAKVRLPESARKDVRSIKFNLLQIAEEEANNICTFHFMQSQPSAVKSRVWWSSILTSSSPSSATPVSSTPMPRRMTRGRISLKSKRKRRSYSSRNASWCKRSCTRR